MEKSTAKKKRKRSPQKCGICGQKNTNSATHPSHGGRGPEKIAKKPKKTRKKRRKVAKKVPEKEYEIVPVTFREPLPPKQAPMRAPSGKDVRIKTSPARIKARERRVAALNLRKRGWGYDRIAEHLGYASRSGAYEAVSTLLKRAEREPLFEVREMEVRRLDDIYDALSPAVYDPPPPPTADEFVGAKNPARELSKARHEWETTRLKAIEAMLKVQARRAAILGLDAPKKQDTRTELTGTNGGPVQTQGVIIDMTNVTPETLKELEERFR